MHELYPFYIVTVKLRDEARPGSSWTMMFEDDTVVCGISRALVEVWSGKEGHEVNLV